MSSIDAVSTRSATQRFQIRSDEALELLKCTHLQQ
jgi:hypothetical protein